MFQVNHVYKLDHRFRILENISSAFGLDRYWVWQSIARTLSNFRARTTNWTRQAELTDDPFSDLSLFTVTEGSIYQTKRDQNFAIIKPVIEHERFYERKERAYLINQLVQEKVATKQTIYRLLRHYWQRGMTPNALIPHYYNSGGKGIKKSDWK